MNKYIRALFILMAPLCWMQPVYASVTTYTLNREQVCNSIFNSPHFNDFLALREFFRLNPNFEANFNPADPRYCLDLRIAYLFFYKNLYTSEDVSQFYQNCLNLNDQQVAFENESFLRLQSAIHSCHLH